MIKLKLTPYEQSLVDTGHLRIEVYRYRTEQDYEYLVPLRCPFCDSDGSNPTGAIQIDFFVDHTNEVCRDCNKSIGTWIQNRKSEQQWSYIPTQKSPIYKQFDITKKVHDTLRGLI